MTFEQPPHDPNTPLWPAAEPVTPAEPVAPAVPGNPVADPNAPMWPPTQSTSLWPPTQAAAPLASQGAAWAQPREGRRRSGLPSVAKVLGIVVLSVAVFAGGIFVGKSDSSIAANGSSAGVTASLPPEFATYTQAWQILHDNFVDPTALDPTKLVYGSINGLVQAIGDTGHTRFLTPAEVKDQHTSLSGSIVGIGAVMDVAQDVPIIQSVIPGGPADRAGLRSGDKILEVDGTSTGGQTIDTVVKRIRGDAGTTVKLSVLHEGDTAPIAYSIVREQVTVPAVSWALIPGTTIADLRLEEFSNGSAKEVEDAIVAAKKAGATSMVLDLRGNPGGYVGEAVDIASQFIKDGVVFQQRDKSGKVTTSPVKPGGEAVDLPLEVLVDLGTASSAEIVAGAIQDAQRAQLIGHTTFGTGTVLSEYTLNDGSALLVGTVEWLTRDGRQIWKQGIVPDIPLESDPAGKIVIPGDLTKLGAAGLAKSGDAPLIKAVELLKAN
jgi:carboxyl-terminal processing protease